MYTQLKQSFALVLMSTALAFSVQAADREPGPDQVIREGLGQLLTLMNSAGGMPPEAVVSGLESELAEYFDFDRMARWVAGPLGRNMNPLQRAAFSAKLKNMFLAALAQRVASAGQGYDYRILPAHLDPRSGEARIDVQLFQFHRPATRLGFRLYHSDKGWKVFDVLTDNSSALVYYRQHFLQLVRQQGMNALF